MTPPPVIEIKNLRKAFGDNHVLNGIDLSVNKGENLVILGRSGSGKSVTIKCLAGLLKADSGQLMVFGTDVAKLDYRQLNKIRLRIGFLFQGGALYDSMTVGQNLAFTLKHHTPGLTDEEVSQQITAALDSVGLRESLDKMPSELSGGMIKRIGLARTLIINPEILLYDEPTAGLDTITSREISALIVSVQKQYKATAIIITHDISCVRITANRIVILRDGIIHAEGSYTDLENSPDEWVRSFFI